jgi:LuxR family maltose regulon positive regulatory protein
MDSSPSHRSDHHPVLADQEGDGLLYEIHRQGLIGRLMAVEAPAVSILSAGVGFGKTILLRQMAQQCATAGLPHALITFTPADIGEANVRKLIKERIAALSDGSGAQPCYLLLDDYHRVRSPAVEAVIEEIADGLPPGSKLIAAGRCTGKDSAAPGATSPAVIRLSEDFLRLTDDEIAQLTRQIPMFAVQETLFAQMHGWPAGCSIVCAVATRAPNLSGPLLAVQVAARVERHLEQLLGPGFDRAGWRLAELMAVGPVQIEAPDEKMVDQVCCLNDLGMVDSDSDEHGSLGLRQPFRDILFERFHRRDGEGFLREVRAAAKRLIDGDLWEDCRHLIRRLPRDVRRSVLEGLGGWILDVRFGPHLFEEFELQIDEDFAGFPQLHLAKAVHLARTNRTLDARWLISQIAAGPAPKDDRLWRADLCINRVRIAIFADEVVPTEDLAELEALQFQDLSASPVLYAISAGVLSDALYRLGQYQKCRESGLRGLVLCDHYKAPYVATYIFALSALAEYRLGNLQSAIQLTERMTDHVAKVFADGDSVHDVAAIISAVMRYEEGDLTSAEALLDRPLAHVLESEGWLEVGLAGFFTAANTAIQRQEYERALDIMMAAEELGTQLGFERLSQLAQCRALYLLSCTDRVDEAVALHARDFFPPDADEMLADRWRDYLTVTQILASCAFNIAQGELELGLRRLDHYLADLGSTQNVPCYVRIICLRLMALHGLERPADEIATAIRTIHFYVEKRGYISPLLEFPQLEKTLKLCLAVPDLPYDVHRLAGLLIERLQHAKPSDAVGGKALSPRQAQILTLLSDGLSNKEIANRLDLAEGTVKSYRKVLYQKLDVSRRSQAVARARTRSSQRA